MDDALDATVHRALDDENPLPGTDGFAGRLADGRLIRDVLGRDLCYVDGGAWSSDPSDLDDPTLLPAGHVRENGETRRAWQLPDPPASADDPVGTVRDALDGALDVSEDGLAVAFSGVWTPRSSPSASTRRCTSSDTRAARTSRRRGSRQRRWGAPTTCASTR